MNERRNFMKLAAAAALPATAIMLTGVARADDNDGNQITGSWQTVHSLPPVFGPSFREFLSFSTGGVVHETNSFLHTTSNLNFSAFGLPNVVTASDGVGNWERGGRGQVQVVFHKLLFDGSHRNFADLKVTGSVTIGGGKLRGEWLVNVVDAEGRLIGTLGSATSEGTRIE
jgi:hypothetical protein